MQIFKDPLFSENQTLVFQNRGESIISLAGRFLYDGEFWHVCTLSKPVPNNFLNGSDFTINGTKYRFGLLKYLFSNLYGFTLDPKPPYEQSMKSFLSPGQKCFLNKDVFIEGNTFNAGTPVVISTIETNLTYAIFPNGEEYKINELDFSPTGLTTEISLIDKAKRLIREKESAIKAYPDPPDLQYLMGYIDGLRKLINE